jgi:hypothetical protein
MWFVIPIIKLPTFFHLKEIKTNAVMELTETLVVGCAVIGKYWSAL